MRSESSRKRTEHKCCWPNLFEALWQRSKCSTYAIIPFSQSYQQKKKPFRPASTATPFTFHSFKLIKSDCWYGEKMFAFSLK